MKHTKPLALLLAVLLLLPFAACGQTAAKGAAPTVPVAKARPLEAPVRGEPNDAFRAAATGANDFALRLSAALVAEADETDNFVCSPYSAWLPLAALLDATGDGYREELLAALGAQGLNAEELNRAASRMLYSLTGAGGGRDGHNPLHIANAVFVDNTRALRADFAQGFLDSYRGQAMAVDFSGGEAVDAVNRWASEQTGGLIDRIIEEFDPNAVAALANAVHFSDRWSWEFNPNQTTDDSFFGPSGETAARFMHRSGDTLPYYEDERVQAMPLRFRGGGALHILLPRDGDAAGLLASLDRDYFDAIQGGTAARTGTLLLPRFAFESGVIDLTEALAALGVPLFDAGGDPLGGLLEGDDPVWLGQAVQRAMIEVNEEGATAAAVTVLEAAAGSAQPEPTEPFEMVCNTPFVFVLTGDTYDGGAQILFTGVVNRP